MTQPANDSAARAWAEFKPALIRSLGRDGAAAFLAHAAQVMAAEARRALDGRKRA